MGGSSILPGGEISLRIDAYFLRCHDKSPSRETKERQKRDRYETDTSLKCLYCLFVHYKYLTFETPHDTLCRTMKQKATARKNPNKNLPVFMTQKQFNAFAKAVYKWQDLLGVRDWEIAVSLDPRPQGDASEEGWCDYKRNGRIATIALKEQMPYKMTNEDLNKLAFHEIFHLVLADLDCMAMSHISYSPDATDRECHKIIARMINLLWSSK